MFRSVGTMVEGIATEGTNHAPVHVFAQARLQLAAGTAAHISPSPSSGLLPVAHLPCDLPREGHDHRTRAVGPTPYCGVASLPIVDGEVLECSHLAVVVCGPGPRHPA